LRCFATTERSSQKSAKNGSKNLKPMTSRKRLRRSKRPKRKWRKSKKSPDAKRSFFRGCPLNGKRFSSKDLIFKKDRILKDQSKDLMIKDLTIKDRIIKDRIIKDRTIKDRSIKDRIIKDRTIKDQNIMDPIVKKWIIRVTVTDLMKKAFALNLPSSITSIPGSLWPGARSTTSIWRKCFAKDWETISSGHSTPKKTLFFERLRYVRSPKKEELVFWRIN
jgi:hypothetical protein